MTPGSGPGAEDVHLPLAWKGGGSWVALQEVASGDAQHLGISNSFWVPFPHASPCQNTLGE